MNYKKIMLITLLLLAVVMIGTVSAEDNSDNLTVSDVGDNQLVDAHINDADLLSSDGESDDDSTDSDEWEDGDSYSDGYNDNYFKSVTYLNDSEFINMASQEGSYKIAVSNGEHISNINYEVNLIDLHRGNIVLSLKDLNITTFGEYIINVTFISLDSENITIIENHNLNVVCDLNISDGADSNNPDDVVVSIYHPSGVEGTFIIKYFYEDEWNSGFVDMDSQYVSEEGILNWTVNNIDYVFGSNDICRFQICFMDINSYESETIAEFDIRKIDSSNFRVDVEKYPYYFSNNTVISVFCPQESTGNIIVNIRGENDKEGTNYTKQVSPNNWVNWTVKELKLEFDEMYYVAVYAGDDCILEKEQIEVSSPINIESVSYIGSDDFNRIGLVEVEISSDISNATIIIKINGTEVFNKNLTDFEEYNYDSLYWTYLKRFGEFKNDCKVYYINNKNIGESISQGNYNMSVTVIIDDNPVTVDGNIGIVSPNLKTENNVTIVIYDSQSYYFKDDDSFIKITTKEDMGDITVVVTAEGETWNLTDSLSNLDDGNICINNFDLYPGDYTVTVSVYGEENNLLVNNTASLSLTFNKEEGMISINELDKMSYYGKAINVYFDLYADWISGNITITVNGEKCYNKHITDEDVEDAEEGIVYGISLKDLNKTLEFNTPYIIAVSYNGDNGLSETDVFENAVLVFTKLDLGLWIDGEDYQRSLNDDNLVRVYPNDDESDFRIIVIINDEVYLNATLSEMDLTYKLDDKGYSYYEVGPVNFNKTISFGSYDNVTVYCICDEYTKNVSSIDEGVNQFIITGILDEVAYDDIETNVISVYCTADDGSINFVVYNKNNGEKIDIDSYVIKEDDYHKLLYWTLENLTLSMGDYHIEIYMDDDWIMVEGDLSVVNNSEFRVKSNCDWFYTTGEVFSVYCPADGEGNVTIYGDNIKTITYTITENNKGKYTSFTLNDLGITLPDVYTINVNVSGRSIGEYLLDVPSPFDFNGNNIVVIQDVDDENEDVMKIVSLNLPNNAEGTVTITVDDGEAQIFDLKDLEHKYSGISTKYTIYISQLTSQEEGRHFVNVNYGFSENRTLSFNKRNINKTEYGSLEMFSLVIDLDNAENNYFAILTIYNNWASINITLNNVTYKIDLSHVDNEWSFEDDVETYKYYITYDLLGEELKPGKYNVSIICYNYDYDESDSTYYYSERVSNNDTITLIKRPYIDVHENEIYLPDSENNNIVHVRSYGENPSSVRIVLLSDDNVLFNDTLDKLDKKIYIDDEGEYYELNITNIKDVKPGRYDNVVAYVYTQYYEVASSEHQEFASFNVTDDSAVSFTNPIDFVYGKTGNTTIILANCTVSEGNISVDGHPEAIITLNNNVITVSNLTYGTYTLKVTTTPSEFYKSVDNSTIIMVTKTKSSVKFNETSIVFNYGESGDVNISCDGCSVDLANISVENHTEAEIKFDEGIITVSNLSAGSYTLKVITTPDDNHESVTETLSITVNKIDSKILFNKENITFVYGESGNVTIALEGASVNEGNISVENQEAGITLENNVITVSDLNVGSYTLNIITTPDNNHNSVVGTINITVSKSISNVVISSVVNATYGGDVEITFADNTTAINAIINKADGSEITSYSIENNKIIISSLAAGNYNITITNPESANYDKSNATSEFTVYKADSKVVIGEIETVIYGNNVTVTLDVFNKTSITAIIVNNKTGKNYNYIIDDSNIIISDLPAGNYNITVINADNENITSSNATSVFTVSKAESNVEFSNKIVFVVGNNATTTITLTGATVNETDIKVNSTDAIVTLKDNVITVSNLSAGNYILNVTTTPDANHTSVTANITVTVRETLINPEFVIGVNATRADSDVTINVTAVDSFNGNVIIKIGETELSINIKNGFGVNTTRLVAGDYNAILNFTATDTYNASYTNQTFAVDPVPVDLNLTVSALNVNVGEHIFVVITTNNTFTGEVLVKIGDVNLTADIVNGVGNATVPILPANGYVVEAVFDGNKYFEACAKYTIVHVNKLDSILNITVEAVYVGSNVTVVVSTHPGFSGNVTVNVNNTDYNVTVNKGSGNLTVSNLTVGKYNVTAQFRETDNFTSSTANATAIVKVIPVDPNLAVSVANINYGASAVVVISTNPAFTGNVDVKVDSANYVVSVVNGAGRVAVSGLVAGSHSVVATFTATDDFTSSVKTTTFKVNNVISLVLKTVKVKKSAKKLTLQATLKINKKSVKGKKITFKFNGKKYTAKTNKNGIAKVTVKKNVLKKLKVGKKVTYTAKYSTKTVKKVVYVKK